MSERRITLTDVMRGIHKHDLINKLTPGCFTFLVGLILAANEIGFKNPIGMSTKQATSAGGGDSRQTVYTRRKALSKIRLDGKPLITCVPGNHARNTVATYTINYNLLCRYNSTWSASTGVMLKNNDSDVTQALLKRDSGATILRSEEKREEDHIHPTVNKVTTGEGVEKSSEIAGGGDFVLTEEKSEEDFEKARRELGCLQVDEPARSELARKYETRYLMRQMAQIKKDFEKDIKFRNPGGALVSRIRNGYITEDYPD